MGSSTATLPGRTVVTSRTLLRWGNSLPRIRAGMTVKSHPFRYQGNLAVKDKSLVFRGSDLFEEMYCEEVIPFDRIIEVILPFDERTQVNIDPWCDIGAPVPFIVRYQVDCGERTVYFTTN